MTFRLICKFKGLLSIFVIALYSPLVLAVGFGNVQVYSYLNEPLSAEIKLFGVESFSRDQIIAQLGSPENFANAKISRPFYLTKFDFDVVKTRDHGTFVYISSKNPIQQPNVEFIVSLSWPDGRMVREFTILLDPAPPSLAKMDRKVPLSQMGAGGELYNTAYRPLPTHNHSVKAANDIKEQVSQKVVESISEVTFANDDMPFEEDEGASGSDIVSQEVTALPPSVNEQSKGLIGGDNEENINNSGSLDEEILNVEDPMDSMSLSDLPAKNIGKVEAITSDMPINVIPDPKVSKAKVISSTDTSKSKNDSDNALKTNFSNKEIKSNNNNESSSRSSLVSMLKSLLPVIAVAIVIVLVGVYFLTRKKNKASATTEEALDLEAQNELEAAEMVDDISAREPEFLGDDDMEEELIDEFDDEEEGSDDSSEMKLRLAKQYIDVGENDSAIEILQELIAVGDEDIRQQAKDLLDEL